MKAGDYMGVGRPIVTNPTGDLKPLFEKFEIGMLVEETAFGFERGLDAFLGDPELAARAGRNAQSVAKGPLSWDHLTDRLEATYESVLGLRPWHLPAIDNLGPEP
jgi:glycosyltransferase involved in cell wall biosynthesis